MRLFPHVVALVVALAVLAGAALPAAAQPQPPNRFFGAATLNGAAPPTGTPVTAFIGGRQCGTGQVRADGRYIVDVVSAGQTPGCGFEGATVAFEVAGVPAAQTATYRTGIFTPLDLTATRPVGRFTEAFLSLADPRPCVPEAGQLRCDPTREALWNGEAAAWTARGVTDPDARFNETVVFRVRAGDPAAISNIARILGTPYLKVTRLRFVGTEAGQGDEFVEITNLGGGDQDMTGWTMRSPDRAAAIPFPAGFVINPGQACRVYTGAPLADACAGASFNAADVWPDDAGTAVLFFDALALPGDETRYSADPNNQPPPPNLQGVE